MLLADDHRMVAEGLRSLLADDFDLVGVVEDGRSLLAEAARLRPDVVVTDITMPQLGGLEALERLRRDHPAIRVVILTMHQEPVYARRALALGAAGYVLKHAAAEDLMRAIHEAHAGRIFVSPEVDELLAQGGAPGGRALDASAVAITARQREVLRRLAEGRTAKEIGAKLGISARTVETHKYELMHALGIKTSAELVHFAIRAGIVDI